MSTTRTSSRRQRILPARYQDDENIPPSLTNTTTTTTTTTTTLPRGRKRSRSPSSTRTSKRNSSQITETQLSTLESDITLKLTASPPALPLPPRITVPLDIDVTDTNIPSWIDMTTDYWTVWRHVYDKWRIQSKFATITAVVCGNEEGVKIACTEIDRLLHIRERLLTDHPDRQDIDLRNRRTVKQVWRYLQRAQAQGEEVAKFSCTRVEREMRWDVDEEKEGMWDQIGVFLVEQGNEGRIFIDPRDYYDHYSWCVEDFGKDVSETVLRDFYNKFARNTTQEEVWKEVLDCDECSTSAAEENCSCEETCLLCVPHTEGYSPISPISSLPSPPRTPGTQSLQAYFKGRRLEHPPLKQRDDPTDDDAAEILVSFSGLEPRPPPSKRRKLRRTATE